MSSTRRMISFVIAITLTVVGWGFVIYFLLFAAGWRGVVVLAAGFVGSLGMFWLYEDFIDATPNKH